MNGVGSRWDTPAGLSVKGGKLDITNGGQVSCLYSDISLNETYKVTIEGTDSKLTCSNYLSFRLSDQAALNIIDEGFVSAMRLEMRLFGDNTVAAINMSTGGMLALFGEADDSLAEFLDLIEGTDKINFWNDSLLDWADITSATMGIYYSLSYMTDGDLAGYTVLTVPEPATLLFISFGSFALARKRRRLIAHKS